ncbi:hypothetical protein GJAV_G00200730 [Gymnothorax javanicus]|nr:hypothetical protein GJAV_G00200730 [Gymnothorax javanicus]
MPPVPLDERIVVVQRPKSLPLREDSPQNTTQQLQTTSSSSGVSLPQPQTQSHSHPGRSLSSSSVRRRKSSHSRRAKGERGTAVSCSGDAPHHSRYSNGTVTLGSGHTHTHTIDIKLSLGANGGAGETVTGKVQGSSLGRSGSVTGNKNKKVSLRLDLGQGGRKFAGTLVKEGGAVQQLQSHPQNKNKTQVSNGHPPNQLSVSPGGVLGFVPAQSQRSKLGKETGQDGGLQSYGASDSHPSWANKEPPSSGNKENSKFGPTHHPSKANCLSHPHCAPHTSVVRAPYTALSPLFSQPQLPFHHQLSQPGQSRSQERLSQHGPFTSRSSSRGNGFPSPDHTCTLNLSQPCGCWKLVHCSGGGRSAGWQGSGFAGVGGGAGRVSNSRVAGLKTLGGCLSASSTTNTSSSNSTMSDCQAGSLKPLGCVPCSGRGVDFESPAAFRKKLVAGCLPCAPLSSSAPLRALQSCVAGCNPNASQTGSSTCSCCSSDPIVMAYNPRNRNGSGAGRGTERVNREPHSVGVFSADDDDYSVRTIWPEELARKMTRSKSLQKHEYSRMGPGTSGLCNGQGQNRNGVKRPVILDSQNLTEFTQSQLTDRAGRRRLQQGKLAVLNFIRSGTHRDDGRDSLKRLWTKGEEYGCGDSSALNGETTSPQSPPPLSPTHFPPQPSAHSTLTKPKENGRESGHSPPPHPPPSAQSLHLVLNSNSREQEGSNGEDPSDLPLSPPPCSSPPPSLSDEVVMTPDVENAALSPILPFLFLGNERDARDLELLLRLNISFVVNVTTHLPLYHLPTGLVHYKRLPATDSSKQNLRQYFEEVFEFIEEAHQSGRGVLVHCQAGVSRSATIVIAYLMKHTLMTMQDAYKYVKSRRPVVSPNLNFMGQLLEFEKDLNSGVTPRILTPKLSGLETQQGVTSGCKFMAGCRRWTLLCMCVCLLFVLVAHLFIYVTLSICGGAFWNQLQIPLDRKRNPILRGTRALRENVEDNVPSLAAATCSWDQDLISRLPNFTTWPGQIQEFVQSMHCREYPLLLDQPEICGRNGEETPMLLLAIKSQEGNFENRQAIRQSWGSEGWVKGLKGKGGIVRRIFLLGKQDASEGPFADVSDLLDLEKGRYRDILQWDFRDTFFNLTLKDVLFWHWFSHRCPRARFVFKGDDDVFVRTPVLLDILEQEEQKSKLASPGKLRDFVVGDVINNALPLRIISNKYYIPENFYKGRYPPYAGGGGLVYSGDLVLRLKRVSRRVHLFPIDDVYVGMCLDRLKVYPIHHRGFLTFDFPKEEERKPCAYHSIVLVHKRTPKEILKIWKELKVPHTECADSTMLTTEDPEPAVHRLAIRNLWPILRL